VFFFVRLREAGDDRLVVYAREQLVTTFCHTHTPLDQKSGSPRQVDGRVT
jgi:hypothetical protein